MPGFEKDDGTIASVPTSNLKKLDSVIYMSSLYSSFHHEHDGIHSGLDFPTEHKRQTLRCIPNTLLWNAYHEFACIFIHMVILIAPH